MNCTQCNKETELVTVYSFTCRDCDVWYVCYLNVLETWFTFKEGNRYYGVVKASERYSLYDVAQHELGTISPDELVYDYGTPILSFYSESILDKDAVRAQALVHLKLS